MECSLDRCFFMLFFYLALLQSPSGSRRGDVGPDMCVLPPALRFANKMTLSASYCFQEACANPRCFCVLAVVLNTTVGSFYLMQFVGNLLVVVASCLYSCEHERYYPFLLLLYLGIAVMGTNILCHRSIDCWVPFHHRCIAFHPLRPHSPSHFRYLLEKAKAMTKMYPAFILFVSVFHNRS